jgi:alkanesulfonate monooxygenase SsuD/methylene tetrahydromethanopterin reductase-like flavin-dependent oxidoreductase (luciferase family)
MTNPADQHGTKPLHLAVALDGAGWHPHSWRADDVKPAELFGADYWIRHVRLAEKGLLDFVTLEDSLALQSALPVAAPDPRTDQVRGRLDAVQLASRLAPETTRIGLVPTTNVTQTEPFHLATQIATLDYTSRGRAGWRVQADKAGESENIGRRDDPELTLDWALSPDAQAFISRRFDEAADVVEVARRLWDSWEDDAVIRDVATGRFLDREKLHYADFAGEHFRVKGPLITPRPPQGQPLVTVLAHAAVPYLLAARAADVVYVTPRDAADAQRIVDEVRQAEATVQRATPLRIFADLVVVIDDTAAQAHERLHDWNERIGAPYVSDAAIVTDSVTGLADLLLEWQRAGIDGYRLRPASHQRDLPGIAEGLVPELQGRGRFRHSYETDTLRAHLGLERPANRYAA